MAATKAGHQQVEEALKAYDALGHQSKASGVVLHRKDQLVADMSFKWVPCLWKFEGNSLVLSPAAGITEAEADSFPIVSTTQYKKPKSKHYPLQFGTSTVYSTVLMEKVEYEASGYANSPLDAVTRPGSAMEASCKLASLDLGELEKLLFCFQAVIEGKDPETYLSTQKP